MSEIILTGVQNSVTAFLDFEKGMDMAKDEVLRSDKGRFIKGSVGNPNGRPKKGETFTDVLRLKANKETIAAKLIALANKGDLNALKYIYDRMDGTPRQTIDQNVSGNMTAASFTIVDKDGNEVH